MTFQQWLTEAEQCVGNQPFLPNYSAVVDWPRCPECWMTILWPGDTLKAHQPYEVYVDPTPNSNGTVADWAICCPHCGDDSADGSGFRTIPDDIR